MIYLTFALMSGYALGLFIARGKLDYLLCFPVSLLEYIVVNTVLSLITGGHVVLAEPGILIAGGLVQSFLLMVGVFLAHRKTKRASLRI